MAKTAKMSDAIVAASQEASMRQSSLPAPLRFPLLVVLSLSLSAVLYSLAATFTAGELSSVSRRLEEWWEVAALVGWKTFELGLGWYFNYDSYDLAALTVLSHGPPLYLLSSFYEIRPLTVLSSLLIDVVTTYLPFRLLRPLSAAHAATSTSDVAIVPNQPIVTDFTIQLLTTILAAAIYSVTLFGAYQLYLPVTLVTYFNDIPSIAKAHASSAIELFPVVFVLGAAARTFIFTPATATAPNSADARKTAFNPVTASFFETLRHNVWGYSKRSKIVISRTATLMLACGVNTFVQCYVTIEGVEPTGALGYAALWVLAAGFTGLSLGLVGAV